MFSIICNNNKKIETIANRILEKCKTKQDFARYKSQLDICERFIVKNHYSYLVIG